MAAPTPVRRGAARHSELFDALVELLLTEGFAHLTLDDVAARLRCSKRTLYTLAGSKEQLVRAAVVRFFARATERVEAAVAACATPADRVAAYLRAVAAELAPASARFVDDMAAFPPAAEVYARNTAAAARRVGELIGEGVAAGDFRDVPVSFAAEMVTATMVAIQQRRIAGATGLADAEAYEALATLLLHGLARDPATPARPSAGCRS
ncbi:TetR/AcrR family transcriptional regulator [Actinomycetospora straminea]|uniref:TetR/AcrR family transcriptional regulator n=1 Tax=Actinomycetospora straminea TaxID=663607 RepID=A0ABP9EFG3_9PSEU|nr:TetR/AcrR family transcriptional regulator [Actinomycetospora straminea]MDD7934403.1 TetR/AcrR family transcriptional regulator [Actinomycetospora straminea]